MLSAVLRSDIAIQVSIQIMKTFVELRRYLAHGALLLERVNELEIKQLESDYKRKDFEQKTEKRLDEVFDYIASREESNQKIFYDGQIFDAYAFVAGLIRKAERRIVLIDSYVDDSVLVQLSKRKAGVTVDIYDGKISQQLRQDVARHNAQYPGVTLHAYNKAHDRFLIIDEDVYHIGHSLKDLGKKLFAFSKMEVMTGSELL